MCLRDIAVLLITLTALAGCAPTIVTPAALDGDRAGATVTMGASVGDWDQIDWPSAADEAAKRCSAWGYTRAEPFSDVRRRCVSETSYTITSMPTPYVHPSLPYAPMSTGHATTSSHCNEWEVTLIYQCLD